MVDDFTGLDLQSTGQILTKMRLRSSLTYGEIQAEKSSENTASEQQQKKTERRRTFPAMDNEEANKNLSDKSKNAEKQIRRLSLNSGNSGGSMVQTRSKRPFLETGEALEAAVLRNSKRLRPEQNHSNIGISSSSSSRRELNYCKFEELDKDMKSVNLKCQIVDRRCEENQTVLFLIDGTDTKAWSFQQSYSSSVRNVGVRLKRYRYNFAGNSDLLQDVPVVGSILPLIIINKNQAEAPKNNQFVAVFDVVPAVIQGQIMVVGKQETSIVELLEEEQVNLNNQICERILHYYKLKQDGIVQSVVPEISWGTRTLSIDEKPPFDFIRDIDRHAVSHPGEEASFRCLVRLLVFKPEVENFIVQDQLINSIDEEFFVQFFVEDNTGVLETLLLTGHHAMEFFGVTPEQFSGENLQQIQIKMENLVYKRNGNWMDCFIKCKWDQQTGQRYHILFNTKLI